MRRLLILSFCSMAVVTAAYFLWASMAPGAAAQQAAAPDSTLPVAPALPRMPQPGDAPTQPIVFSHKIHAGDNQIACLYCHVSADESAVASVPSVETCMGCHRMVGAAKPEVQKLAKYWAAKQPIPWIKVHDIPDHSRFNHKRHVKAGIACQTCHGPVETMDKVRLQQKLTMGFCISCHQQEINNPQHPANLDCATCHY
jgi:predicted CXXCH cytochrome family protein